MQIIFKSGAKINGIRVRSNKKSFCYLMAFNRLTITGVDKHQIVVSGHELVVKDFLANNEVTNFVVIE